MTQIIDPSMERAAQASEKDDRRKRLREFQSELVERMQAARSSTDATANHLGVLIGNTRWLIDLQEVGEIVPVGAIAKVPLTQSWYLGLFNLRGNLIGVVDFSRYQGLSFTDVDAESRVVTFASRLSLNCGLLVSRILGLRNMAEMTLQSSSTQETEAPIQLFLDLESVRWNRLSLSALVQSPRFLQIGS